MEAARSGKNIRLMFSASNCDEMEFGARRNHDSLLHNVRCIEDTSRVSVRYNNRAAGIETHGLLGLLSRQNVKISAANGVRDMLSRQVTDPKPTNDEWELIRIDMLTEKECAEVLSVVHDLIGYKSGTRLGSASYRSLPLIGKKIDKYPIGRQINKYIYQRRAMKLNPIFRERLGWLYDRLAKTLAHALRAPTRYPDDLALPGFHVNQEAIREKTVGPFRTGPAPHFDLQCQKIDWAIRVGWI
ncbi:MAG: hypothetical protein ACJ8H8_28490 [Geminicoccaceae bacterium]